MDFFIIIAATSLMFGLLFGSLVVEAGAPICKSDTRPRNRSRK